MEVKICFAIDPLNEPGIRAEEWCNEAVSCLDGVVDGEQVALIAENWSVFDSPYLLIEKHGTGEKLNPRLNSEACKLIFACLILAAADEYNKALDKKDRQAMSLSLYWMARYRIGFMRISERVTSIKSNAVKAALASHSGNHVAKHKAIEIWEKDKGKYKSRAQAARKISSEVNKTERVVDKWLAEHEKQKKAKA